MWEPTELRHHLFLANLCSQSDFMPGNPLCIRQPQHCWFEPRSTRSRLCISQLKKKKNLAEVIFTQIGEKSSSLPGRRQLQTSRFLPSKNLWRCQKMFLTTHRKSVTAGLESEKLVPSRPASHPDSSCLGSALKGASCPRTLMRRAFKCLLPTDLMLNASSADTKDQSWGCSCSWKYELHTDWERTSSTGRPVSGGHYLGYF